MKKGFGYGYTNIVKGSEPKITKEDIVNRYKAVAVRIFITNNYSR